MAKLTSSPKFLVVLLIGVFSLITVTALQERQSTRSLASVDLTPTSGRPFADNSVWNTPIEPNPEIDPDNAAMMANLVTGQHGAALYEFGTPVFFADASTPRFQIDCTQPWGTCGLEGESVPIPDGVQPAPGSDGQMVIVDLSTRKSYEFWQYKNDKATTSWGGVLSIDGDGRGTPQNHAVGAGTSRLAGVVRTYEMQQGVIEHALVLSTSFCQGPDNGTNFRYPATKTDGKYLGTGGVPEGARLQLDPAVNVETIPGITQGEKTVAKALQKYGAYVIDCGGATMAFSFENPIGKTDPYKSVGFANDYFEMSHIPWDKVRVLKATTQAIPSSAVPSALNITPSFYPLAPCPTCVNPSTAPLPSGYSAPTGTAALPTSGIGYNAPTVDPCNSESASLAADKKKKKKSKHKDKDGGISKGIEAFFKFLLELIMLLLKLLGGGQLPQPNPVPAPTGGVQDPCLPSAAPTAAPSLGQPGTPSTMPIQSISQAPISQTPLPSGAAGNLTFNDDFNGTTLDTSKWEIVDSNNTPGGYSLGGSCFVNDGQHVLVSNGTLILRATQAPSPIECNGGMWNPKNFLSGFIWTRNKFSQAYGRFEMRAKLPDAKGAWPAFWMWSQEGRYNNAWAEIDIMEAYDYGDHTDIGATLHEVGGGDTQWCPVTPDVSGDFHTYTMDWSPNKITIYYDNKLCKTFTNWTPPNGMTNPQPFDQPLYMLLNLTVGMNFGPNGATQTIPDVTNTWPMDMVVDYVRVWK